MLPALPSRHSSDCKARLSSSIRDVRAFSNTHKPSGPVGSPFQSEACELPWNRHCLRRPFVRRHDNPDGRVIDVEGDCHG